MSHSQQCAVHMGPFASDGLIHCDCGRSTAKDPALAFDKMFLVTKVPCPYCHTLWVRVYVQGDRFFCFECDHELQP